MIKKLVNENYLNDENRPKTTVNEANRAYIDRFVRENYNALYSKFQALDSKIDSSTYSALDKLNETILSLYTDKELTFENWKSAKRFLQNKFTEKEKRTKS